MGMEFQDVLRRRRMVRSFDDRRLPASVVERILGNGLRAPSAGFTQGSELLVLQGAPETGRYWAASFASEQDRDRFRWPGLLAAPLLVVAFADERAYRDRYEEPDKDRPPHRAPWTVPYWHVDTGFAALLMCLTAVDAGMGALFFAVARPDRVREAFGVPERYEPVGAVAIGYPLDEKPSRSVARGRRAPEEVLHRGRW